MTLFIFDLDHTLIKGNCSFSFCCYLVKQGILSWYALFSAVLYHIRHVFFGLELEALHKAVFKRFLKGLSLDLLKQHAAIFLDSYLESQWYEPAVSALKAALNRGDHVLILSNSPSFLVEKVAEKLGVDQSLSTEYAVDSEGSLCAITIIMSGVEKRSAMQRESKRLGIPLNKVVAYSDSHDDLPLLFAVGRAVGVNPDRKLLSVCLERGWEVL